MSLIKVYGSMEWFDTDGSQPERVPKVLKDARRLWEKDPENNLSEVIALLEPFIRSIFVPSAISASEELFSNQDDIPADSIKIIGVRYKGEGSFIPECKAEAWYTVSTSDDFDHINMEEWQEEKGEFLHQGVSFSWQIPDGKRGSTEFFYGNHLGVECYVLSSEESDSSAGGASEKSGVKYATLCIEGITEPKLSDVRKYLESVWHAEIQNLSEIMEAKETVVIKIERDSIVLLSSVLFDRVNANHITLKGD